jgi:hypothetical protein
VSRRRFASSAAVALAWLTLAAPVLAQAGLTGEAQVKAAFVYNFLKFVVWPEGAFDGPDDPLVVALVGDGPTAEATAHFLSAKQVGSRPLVVRRVAWDQALAGVHAVFVAESDVDKLRRIFAAASTARVLSIGEGASFAAGGGVIALVVEERKVRFDIDMAAARTAGLTVSSKLLALTRVVHDVKGAAR